MISKIIHLRRLIKHYLELIEYLGLFVIACATIYAGISEIAHMIGTLHVSLADLLMLFLYLEVISMVSVYFNTVKLPVRFPLYIAMVAIARHIIIGLNEMGDWQLFASATGIVIISIAVLIVRYGHTRFPYSSRDDE